MAVISTQPNNRLFIFWVTAIGALGGFLFGYDTGVVSGALIFIKQEFHLTTFLQEVIVSSVVLGALCGALMSGWLADSFGRKFLLRLAALAFFTSTLLTTFSHQINWLIAGRFITGLAIGVTSYTAPLYIAEMAPAKFRGSLVLVNAITITGGETVAFLMGYLLAPFAAWRWMFALGLLPAITLYIGMFYLPETPRWLVRKGKIKQAQQVLSRLHLPDTNLTHELQAIEQNFSLKSHHWQQLFSSRIRPVLIIGVLLGIFQQFFGINTVMYYGPTIFQAIGFQHFSTQILATFAMGAVNTIFSGVCVLIIDYVGRRRMLLLGSGIAAVSLLLVGFSMQRSVNNLAFQWLALICMVSYIAGYCISVGSLFWLIISEIFPLSIRGLGMSIVTAVQWAANFLVSISFLHLLQGMGPTYTFWLYALMCLLCLFFCYFWVPETKGVSLEVIEANLAARKPSRELGLSI